MLHSPAKKKNLWGKSLQLLGTHILMLMLSGYTSNYVCNMTTPIHLAVIFEAICLLYTYIHTICFTDTVGMWLCCTGELSFKNSHSNSLKGWKSVSHDVLPGNSSSYCTVISTQFLSSKTYNLYVISPLSYQYRSCMQTGLTEIYRTELSSVVHL